MAASSCARDSRTHHNSWARSITIYNCTWYMPHPVWFMFLYIAAVFSMRSEKPSLYSGVMCVASCYVFMTIGLVLSLTKPIKPSGFKFLKSPRYPTGCRDALWYVLRADKSVAILHVYTQLPSTNQSGRMASAWSVTQLHARLKPNWFTRLNARVKRQSWTMTSEQREWCSG